MEIHLNQIARKYYSSTNLAATFSNNPPHTHFFTFLTSPQNSDSTLLFIFLINYLFMAT